MLQKHITKASTGRLKPPVMRVVGARNVNHCVSGTTNDVTEDKELRLVKSVTEHLKPFQSATVMERKGMRSRIIVTLALLFVVAITVLGSTALGKPARGKAPRSVQSDRTIRKLSSQELQQVFDDHKEWLKAHPQNYDSQEAQSDRRRADLTGVGLQGATLIGVRLLGADLSTADLTMANLTKAGLDSANLTRANLSKANLAGANLPNANLTGAILLEANLSGAELSEANLQDAILTGAIVTKADLASANLSGANAVMANLTRAFLHGANLTRAFFVNANLTGADLSAADLTKANLHGTNLSQVIFEPKQLPDAAQIAYAGNLSEMRWVDSPQAMVMLRKAFRDAGYGQQERELTYAIEHNQTLSQFRTGVDSKSASALLEAAFLYVFFELTTKWGMAPGRALWLLIALIPVFTVPYVIALHRPGEKGIWRTWTADRVRTDIGTQDVERLHVGWLRALLLGLYFSVLSAFNIGWRELNVGNWIQRLQANEYTLRPTGWVRTVSGVQALVSVFLLAMWALTYFGRPFE